MAVPSRQAEFLFLYRTVYGYPVHLKYTAVHGIWYGVQP